MIPPFDIFKAETDGSVLWIEAAIDLERAKSCVAVLAKSLPCGYIILSQKTGHKISIKS